MACIIMMAPALFFVLMLVAGLYIWIREPVVRTHP